jgi:acyl carrier protein
MTTDEIYDQLRELLTTKFQVPATVVRPEATFEELDLDSLAMAELTMTIREILDMSLDDEGITTEHTLGETAAWLHVASGASDVAS